jgi:hypothetical protein
MGSSFNYMNEKERYAIERFRESVKNNIGESVISINYSILENDQALNVAIQDFKNNWNDYIERWNKWYEERK